MVPFAGRRGVVLAPVLFGLDPADAVSGPVAMVPMLAGALDPEAPAKYLNSPETQLFHKGSILFNGAKARIAVHDGKALIVVEGYVDVIAMVTAGFEVSSFGESTKALEDTYFAQVGKP